MEKGIVLAESRSLIEHLVPCTHRFSPLRLKNVRTWGMHVILFRCLDKSIWEMSELSIRTEPSMHSTIRNKSNEIEDLPAPVRPTIATYKGNYFQSVVPSHRSTLSSYYTLSPGLMKMFTFFRQTLSLVGYLADRLRKVICPLSLACLAFPTGWRGRRDRDIGSWGMSMYRSSLSTLTIDFSRDAEYLQWKNDLTYWVNAS